MCVSIQTNQTECLLPVLFPFIAYLWAGLVGVAPGKAGGRPRVAWRTGDLWFPGRRKGRSKGQSSEGTASRVWGEEAGLVRAGSRLLRPPWHCWVLYVWAFVCALVCTCTRLSMCGEGEKGGCGLDLGLCLNLVCSGTARERKTKEKVVSHVARSLSVPSKTIISLSTTQSQQVANLTL